jgi:hypothetical protein
MTRSALILGVAHELQGPGFLGYVHDPSYLLLVEGAMIGVDFVFEEARVTDRRSPRISRIRFLVLGTTPTSIRPGVSAQNTGSQR